MTSAVAIPEATPVEFADERLNERQRAGAAILRQIIREKFDTDEDDDGAEHRVAVPISAWKEALKKEGWPSAGGHGEKARGTRIGQRAERDESDCGQASDNSRTKESFDQEFYRLRKSLVKEGLITIDGKCVFLTKG